MVVQPKRVLVIGGTGFVGQEVCKIAVQRGFSVKSLSRRGLNPDESDDLLNQVMWTSGDATDVAVVTEAAKDTDCVVHAAGLLFDIESGLANYNKIVSGSGSVPGDESTYDAITRQTAFNTISAIQSLSSGFSNPFAAKAAPYPFAFVSAAEAGWPDVPYGEQVESIAPGWLVKYLAAKRSVESKLAADPKIRPIIYRPSLIWNWKKFDVLPVIPIFNLANQLGVPFVDRTVRVETIAGAIVAGLEDEQCTGVMRFTEMEELAARL